MIFNRYSRIRFLFSSTNHHGVHSPFVFNYLTKCLYREPGMKLNKSMGVLVRSIPYFEVQNIRVNQENEALINELRSQFPKLRINIPPYDFVVCNIADLQIMKASFKGNGMLSQDAIFFFPDLYKSKTTKDLWESVIQSPQFNVSIDLYYCGLLFRRKEQRKQHFKVRI